GLSRSDLELTGSIRRSLSHDGRGRIARFGARDGREAAELLLGVVVHRTGVVISGGDPKTLTPRTPYHASHYRLRQRAAGVVGNPARILHRRDGLIGELSDSTVRPCRGQHQPRHD